MTDEMRIEFELKAFGEDKIEGYEDSFKGLEMARTKSFSKEASLADVELVVKELFKEIQSSYGKKPEQLSAKIVIRLKEEENSILYL
ncbi:hypothetical protein [Bacillus sp. 1P06AnD]|uniref:hypothetical protein n=1 Tax=Bacillus sp. 1P06AnD TaxID=3132208 RepID=UPI0039A3AA56